MDFMIKAPFKPHSKWLAKADYHIFRYAEDDSFGQNGLGNELDLTLVFKPRKGVSNVLGFSVFTPSDVFKRIKGDETAYWLYNMLTVAF